MSLAVNISDLTFSWSKQHSFALNIANWQVSEGQSVFLYGPSGSGKSTLLNLLSGVLCADAGKIEIFGENLTALSAKKRDIYRADNIGVIFQQFNLLPFLTGLQNIQLASAFRSKKLIIDTDFEQNIYNNLSLTEGILKQKANTLSVGQQQRIAVARALIGKPKLIIADEPTSALDTDLRDSFIQLLLENAADSSVIFVSHDRSLASIFDLQYDIQALQSKKDDRYVI
ncbi:MAG: putative ABC transport system ATP-binding protein [Paraglaciecola sp.]|jgi:putative ABC transport system ATP-binding protein